MWFVWSQSSPKAQREMELPAEVTDICDRNWREIEYDRHGCRGGFSVAEERADWKFSWVWSNREDDVVSLPKGAIPCGPPQRRERDKKHYYYNVYFWEPVEP